jgi:Tol biopolymer transport system component
MKTSPLLIVACSGLVLPATAQVTQRVSVSSAGVEGNGTSARQPDLTPDGRYIVFESTASDLVPGDTNGTVDIFVRDRTTGTTTRVSVDAFGAESNGDSRGPCISADGRYVAFESTASNLVPGDANGVQDDFLKDLQTGAVEILSVDSFGAPSDGDSFFPAFSSDARYVVFMSLGTTLVAGDTNGERDIFVRDRQTATTERVSVSSLGVQGDGDCPIYPAISRDGRYVVFYSTSSNLVAGDTNGTYDTFLRDRQLGVTERISVATGGGQADSSSSLGTLSDDGRYVTFMSSATNLVPGDVNLSVDCFVRDRLLGTTDLVSVGPSGIGNGFSEYPMPSADGRYVIFSSNATNLVPGDTNAAKDIFLRDQMTGVVERLSVDSFGGQGNALVYYYSTISPDGRFIAYASTASNLVPDDTNTGFDVFLRDRNPPGYISRCEPGVGIVMACPCGNPASGPARGCDNSSSTGGAVLAAGGGAYLSSDSLAFFTSGEKPTALSIVLQGTTLIPGGVVYGQGVRCVGGSLKRLFTKTASGGSITAPNFGAGDPMIHARSTQLGDPLSAATTRWYLVYYRDPNVLGGCPAASTFNSTQTIEVSWSP